MFTWADTLCITNRHLVPEDAFLPQIKRIAAEHPKAIILREKDLPEAAYAELLTSVADICGEEGVPLYAHTFVSVACRQNAREPGSVAGIHLPLPVLRELAQKEAVPLPFGVSTHTVEEALEAEALGAAYITTGHVFATDCKPGVPPKGLEQLQNVCHAVHIPVYALGGVHPDNADACLARGAAGVAVMSECMNL